jgi:hypothetical protein
VITSGGFFTAIISLFLSLKVKLGGDRFKDGGDVETDVTRRVITKHGSYRLGTHKPYLKKRLTE